MFPATCWIRTNRPSERRLTHQKIRVLDDGSLVPDAVRFAIGDILREDFDVAKPGPGDPGNLAGHVAFSALAEVEDTDTTRLQSLAGLSNNRLVDAEALFLAFVDKRQRALPEVRACPAREPQANPVRHVKTSAVVERRRRDHRIQLVNALRPAVGGVLKQG